jgi:hypothetical protein
MTAAMSRTEKIWRLLSRLLAGVCLLSLGTCLVGLVYEWNRGWTPGKIERLINASCPAGTPRSEVKAWLESDPFTAALPSLIKSDIYNDIVVGLEKERRYTESLTQEKDGKLHWSIWKYVPYANVDPLSTGTISVVFHFDEQDRLAAHEIKTWISSL